MIKPIHLKREKGESDKNINMEIFCFEINEYYLNLFTFLIAIVISYCYLLSFVNINRIHYLDNLRAIAMLLGLVLHAGVFSGTFVVGPWRIHQSSEFIYWIVA